MTTDASDPPICPAWADLTLILSGLYPHYGSPTPTSADAALLTMILIKEDTLPHQECSDYEVTEWRVLIAPFPTEVSDTL